MNCEIVRLDQQEPPLLDKQATWCNTHRRREVECLRAEVERLKAQEFQLGELRTAALNILHEIAADSDGGQKRYESYGPLFNALWSESQKQIPTVKDGEPLFSDGGPNFIEGPMSSSTEKFIGVASCPKCHTSGLLREDGVIEDSRFHGKLILCEACKGGKC